MTLHGKAFTQKSQWPSRRDDGISSNVYRQCALSDTKLKAFCRSRLTSDYDRFTAWLPGSFLFLHPCYKSKDNHLPVEILKARETEYSQ